MGNNFAVDKLIEDTIAEMKRQGAEIVDPADLPSEGIGPAESDVLSYEFKADLNAYLASLGPNARCKSLADVIAFNDQHQDREMPWFRQELMLKSQARGPLTDKIYLDSLAKSKKLSREEGIDAVIGKFKLDAIIAPTAGPSWVTDWVNGDNDTGGCSTPAAVAGLSAHHRARRLRRRPSHRHLFLRRRLDRARPAQTRLLIRAGHQSPPRAAVPQNAPAYCTGS